MKKVLVFLIALILSTLLVLAAPNILSKEVNVDNSFNSSLVEQKITGYSDTNIVYYKVYDSGKLIGVTKDKNNLIYITKNYDFNTDYEYDKNTVDIAENIYIVEELTKVMYEDVDDKIVEYLINNNCVGIKTKCVLFYTDKGVYDKIYISNEDDFKNAINQFILNFISQDALNKINSGETIGDPLSLGSIDTGINIEEKTEITTGIALPNEILTSEKDIYEFLCYGHNQERQYYTTIEGDTLAGVGYHFKNMSAKQIMMLNPDIVKNENQILEAGTVLNVTYYNSPLHVVVTKKRLAQEVVFPEPPIYVEDDKHPIGYSEIVQNEENGIQNVLYLEKWINGERQESQAKQIGVPYVVKAAVRGQIVIGAGSIINSQKAGSGNWRWPVQNPTITCDYYCYAGHGGVDFYNLYNPWDYVLAIDNGVVVDTGWTNLGGYYARVDHNNGFITYYGHFSSMPTVEKGQSVSAGEILGPIGMTGNASGPHVHLAMYENGVLINPCSVLDCSILY